MQKLFSIQSTRTLGLLLSGAASVMVLTACSTYQDSFPPTALRQQVHVAESIERLELYSRPNGLDLSARDRDAVAHFVQTYQRYGDGPLYINVPANAADGLGAKQAQQLIRQDLMGYGMGGSRVETGQYQAAAHVPAPVVVSYRRLKAIPEDCRKQGSMTQTSTNQPYAGFGCAQTSNLAAMIDDPRQLLEPYAFGSPNSARRMTIYDKYINGENPASTQPARQEISSDSN